MIFTIRHAFSEDAEAILNVRNMAIATKGREYYSDEILNNWAPEVTEESIARLQKKLIQDNSFWLVAIDDETSELVGYCSINSETFSGGAMYIKPYKSSFVAIGFAKRMKKLLVEKQVKEVTISASLNAEPVYKAMGFKTTEYDQYTLRDGSQMPCAKMVLEL